MSLTVRVFEAAQPTWDDFLARPQLKSHVSFMHTWEWGSVMSEKARDFVRLGIYDGEQLVGLVQAARYRLKIGGDFWYSPRGAAIDYSNSQLVTETYRALSTYFRGKGVAFYRADPDIVRGDPAEAAIDSLTPGQAAIFTQAERVWCVDLQDDEEQLMAWLKEHGMRKNVPYYLRKNIKAGVTVRASDSAEDLEKMITLLNELNERKGGIGKHMDDHYRLQFAALAPKGYEKVFLAEKDGQVLAGALISIYGREAGYLHGARSSLERELSASHYLHYEIMKYLQENNPEIARYNLWGIVSDKNRTPKHPRHGYSEFKRSFGGYKEHYIRARDFFYNWPVWKLDWFISAYRAWKHKND